MSSLPPNSMAETGSIAAEMLAMLKEVQWRGERDSWQTSYVCPFCFSTEHAGHDKNCELAALIAKAEGQVSASPQNGDGNK